MRPFCDLHTFTFASKLPSVKVIYPKLVSTGIFLDYETISLRLIAGIKNLAEFVMLRTCHHIFVMQSLNNSRFIKMVHNDNSIIQIMFSC